MSEERTTEHRFQEFHQRLRKCEDLKKRVVRAEAQIQVHLDFLREYAERMRDA